MLTLLFLLLSHNFFFLIGKQADRLMVSDHTYLPEICSRPFKTLLTPLLKLIIELTRNI